MCCTAAGTETEHSPPSSSSTTCEMMMSRQMNDRRPLDTRCCVLCSQLGDAVSPAAVCWVTVFAFCFHLFIALHGVDHCVSVCPCVRHVYDFMMCSITECHHSFTLASTFFTDFCRTSKPEFVCPRKRKSCAISSRMTHVIIHRVREKMAPLNMSK